MTVVDFIVADIGLFFVWVQAILNNWVVVPANVADPLGAASLTPFGTDYVAALASLAVAWSGSLAAAMEILI